MQHWKTLLGVALGQRPSLDATPTAAEWETLFTEARRQALVAVLFAAVERLPAAQRPPRPLLLVWMAEAQRVVRLNRRLDEELARVVARLECDGFPVVLLKGRGVAQYYPDPDCRMTGDIDVWLGAKARKIWAYSRRYGAKPRATCLHVALPLSECVEVEAHYFPSYRFNPWANARLRRWFAAAAPEQFVHRVRLRPSGVEVAVPTDRFNRIYLLLHLYRHFLNEGVGLRHLVDYYYLLARGCTEAERRTAQEELHRLGLTRFAGAVMYALTDLLGLPAANCLVPPDAVRGKRLLAEIRLSGNFGQADLRHARPVARLGRTARFARKCRRAFSFLQDDPAEALSIPLFSAAHFLWRRWKGFA